MNSSAYAGLLESEARLKTENKQNKQIENVHEKEMHPLKSLWFGRDFLNI